MYWAAVRGNSYSCCCHEIFITDAQCLCYVAIQSARWQELLVLTELHINLTRSTRKIVIFIAKLEQTVEV